MFILERKERVMKKVLLVEDTEWCYEKISKVLDSKVEVIWADSLEKGKSLFGENPDIDLIIMDACVPGDAPNSMPLIKHILEAGFKNPIIGCSSMSFYTNNLIEAGATHKSDKDKVGKLALELLGIQ